MPQRWSALRPRPPCAAPASRLPYPNPSPPTELTGHPVTLDLPYPEWTVPRIPIPIVAPRGGRGTYITYRLYGAAAAGISDFSRAEVPDSQPLLPYFSIDSRSGCGLEDLVSFLVVIVHF